MLKVFLFWLEGVYPMSYGGYGPGGPGGPGHIDPYGSTQPGYRPPIPRPGYGPPTRPGSGPPPYIPPHYRYQPPPPRYGPPPPMQYQPVPYPSPQRPPHPGAPYPPGPPRRSRAGLIAALAGGLVLLVVLVGVAWKVGGGGKDTGSIASSATPTSRAGLGTETSSPRSTRTRTSTAPPRSRATVADLNSGDCVELQEGAPDSNSPGTTDVTIYKVGCETRGEIYQVLQIAPAEDQCPSATTSVLFNSTKTVYACMDRYRP